MLISKEEFVKYITAMKDLFSYKDEAIELLQKYNPYTQAGYWDYPSCDEELCELLEKVTGDSDYIRTFCYDLNFGKYWEPGCVLDHNGDELELATIEDLWEVLNRNG